MTLCEAMCEVYFKELAQFQNNETCDEQALLAASAHIESCASCMAVWKRVKQSTPKPRIAWESPWGHFFSTVVAVTELPPSNIAADTLLGPFQVARILILLAKKEKRRVCRPPSGVTVGRLAELWEQSAAMPERTPPALKAFNGVPR